MLDIRRIILSRKLSGVALVFAILGQRWRCLPLRDQLSSNGVECSAVDLHSEFGSAWVQKSEGTSFYVLITQADGTHGRWLLSIEPTSVLTFLGLRKHRVRELEVCQRIMEVLDSRGDVTQLAWFDSRKELNAMPPPTGRAEP